jgi:hypothetical protein
MIVFIPILELSKDYDGKMEGVANEDGTKYGKEVTKRVDFEDPTSMFPCLVRHVLMPPIMLLVLMKSLDLYVLTP